MIDVDVVQQLVPNATTMLVQLCATLFLFLVARKYLWPSVKNMLDARTTKMQSDLTDAADAKQEALVDRQKALEQLTEASGKADDIVNAAIKQAKDEKDSILERADKEAQATKQRAHEQIEAERKAMEEDMKKEMVDIALAAAGKLIGNQNAEDFDRDAINEFIKDTEKA